MRSPCLDARGISDFDILTFHAAFDEARTARGLSWAALAEEFNQRIRRVPGIPPLSSSTLSGMAKKGGLNANIVMGCLRWMGRTPESFMAGHPDAEAKAPYPPGPLDPRWDVKELHAVIEERRASHGQTLKAAADEIGTTTSVLGGIAKGGGVGFPGVMRITVWLDRPATDFVVEAPWNQV